MLVVVGEEASKSTGGLGREAVVVDGSRVAGELGQVAEWVGGSKLIWGLGRVGEEGRDLVLAFKSIVVIHKLLDQVTQCQGVAGGLVVKEEVLVRWFLWGEVAGWLLLEEELLLDLAEADLMELAGEVDSQKQEEGAEEKGEEGEGGSGLAIGCSPSTTIVTFPRSCRWGLYQWHTCALARR